MNTRAPDTQTMSGSSTTSTTTMTPHVSWDKSNDKQSNESDLTIRDDIKRQQFIASVLTNLSNPQEPILPKTMEYCTQLINHCSHVIDATTSSTLDTQLQKVPKANIWPKNSQTQETGNQERLILLHRDFSMYWSYSIFTCTIQEGTTTLHGVYYIPHEQDKKDYIARMARPITKAVQRALQLEDHKATVTVSFVKDISMFYTYGVPDSGTHVLLSIFQDEGFYPIVRTMKKLGLEELYQQLPTLRQRLVLMCIAHWQSTHQPSTCTPSIKRDDQCVNQLCERLAHKVYPRNREKVWKQFPSWLRCPVCDRPMRYPVVCNDHQTYDIECLNRLNRKQQKEKNIPPIKPLAFNKAVYLGTTTWLSEELQKASQLEWALSSSSSSSSPVSTSKTKHVSVRPTGTNTRSSPLKRRRPATSTGTYTTTPTTTIASNDPDPDGMGSNPPRPPSATPRPFDIVAPTSSAIA